MTPLPADVTAALSCVAKILVKHVADDRLQKKVFEAAQATDAYLRLPDPRTADTAIALWRLVELRYAESEKLPVNAESAMIFEAAIAAGLALRGRRGADRYVQGQAVSHLMNVLRNVARSNRTSELTPVAPLLGIEENEWPVLVTLLADGFVYDAAIERARVLGQLNH